MFNSSPDPQDFQPAGYGDLIGPAALVGRILAAKAERLHQRPEATGVRLLLAGVPGCGKTELAALTACQLTGERLRDLRAGMATGGTLNIEARNGRLVDAERVRGWMNGLRMGNLFGNGWQVKLVNEMDLVSTAAQDLLLDYLDAIRNIPGQAFIGTSNKSTAELTARYQSRFQHFEVEAPTDTEIADFLVDGWQLNRGVASMIAAGACGNVRQALLDAQGEVDSCLAAAA